jgi:hypothetical protein
MKNVHNTGVVLACCCAVACAGATRQGDRGTAPAARLVLARQYGCAPASVADTARAPILRWIGVGVGTEPCELIAHYPDLPHIVRLPSRHGMLRERWEFYYGNPARHWMVYFEGPAPDRLRATEMTEPQVRD